MARHSTSGRAQRQVMKGPDGKDYLVVEPLGTRLFTVRVGDDFYEALDRIIKKLPDGSWSYGAVVRKLVREADGASLPKEQLVPVPVKVFLRPEIKEAMTKYSKGRQDLFREQDDGTDPGINERALAAMEQWERMFEKGVPR